MGYWGHKAAGMEAVSALSNNLVNISSNKLHADRALAAHFLSYSRGSCCSLILDEIFIMLFTHTQKSISIFFILSHFLVLLKIYIPSTFPKSGAKDGVHLANI